MFTLFFQLIDGIKNIWNAIIGFINFIVNAITSLLALVAHIPQYMSFMSGAINVLPAIIVPFALAAITIYVVLFFLGR